MAGPWERYQRQQPAPQAQAEGPWVRYQQQAASAAPAPPVAPPEELASSGLGLTEGLAALATSAGPGGVHMLDQVREASPGASRAFGIGAQGAGRGLADLAGLFVDIPTLGINAGLSGAEMIGRIFDEDFDLPQVTNPVGGGDWIADAVGGGAEALGVPLVDPEEIGGLEKLIYNVSRFGTEAAAGGGALAGRAAAVASTHGLGTRSAPTVLGGITQPYLAGNAGRAIAADTAGGVGMGVGSTAAEEFFPDSIAAEMAMMLGGGMAGGAVANRALKPGGISRAVTGWAEDPSLAGRRGIDPPVSRRTADVTAEIAQNRATNPQRAAATIGDRLGLAEMYADPNARGYTPAEGGRPARGPVATTGVLSEDAGLADLERAFRAGGENRVRFAEQDKLVRGGAYDRLASLIDPDADYDEALEYARQKPAQLAAEREAAALPLLRAAEARGARIDAQPVVDAIDSALSTAKREPVRRALTQARQMLNKVGSDELDDSVEGLYETRKAINDIIEGRTDNATGRFAQGELIEVKKALDAEIIRVVPEFGEYLDTFRARSAPINEARSSRNVQRLINEETDLRNVARDTLGGKKHGGDDRIREVTEYLADNPEATRAWRSAVAEELVSQIDRTGRPGEASIAEVRRTFERNRDALGQVFPPEDLTVLDSVHEMLKPLEDVAGRAGALPNFDNQQVRSALEAGLFATGHGAIAIGMIMKRFTVAGNTLRNLGWTTRGDKVMAALERMQVDPDFAKLILERPTGTGAERSWARRLQHLITAGEGSRELFSEEDEDDELMQAIGGGQ